jgi:hypothetical protein
VLDGAEVLAARRRVLAAVDDGFATVGGHHSSANSMASASS